MTDDQSLVKKIPDVIDKVRECILNKRYRLTDHAIERQLSRKITLPVIRHVLLTGEHYPLEDRFRKQFHSWSYAIIGKDLDNEELKIIVSFSEEGLMFIVTVMYIIK